MIFKAVQFPINNGMRVFNLIWLGQVISQVGSYLTAFALDIWVFQRTGSVTQLTLVTLCTTLPPAIISPVAGTLVDMWSRRWTMIISDACAGLCNLSMALLYATNSLDVWCVCLVNTLSSSFALFQSIAYTAAIPMFVPKKQLGLVSGMNQLERSLPRIISPALAVILLGAIQLQGVILIDFATLLIALVPLLSFKFSEFNDNLENQKIQSNSLFRETAYGWKYIVARPGLLGLFALLTIHYFVTGFLAVLLVPLVLSLTEATGAGLVISVSSVAFLVGSLAISLWGDNQKRLINVIFGCTLLSGICLAIMGLSPSLLIIALALFFYFLTPPLIRGSAQVILQKVVAFELQGRIFAVNKMLSRGATPLAIAIAGLLTDRIFEPLMAFDGLFAGSLGQIIGSGLGRGIGLLFVIMGITVIIATLITYQYPPLREVEDMESELA